MIERLTTSKRSKARPVSAKSRRPELRRQRPRCQSAKVRPTNRRADILTGPITLQLPSADADLDEEPDMDTDRYATDWFLIPGSCHLTYAAYYSGSELVLTSDAMHSG